MHGLAEKSVSTLTLVLLVESRDPRSVGSKALPKDERGSGGRMYSLQVEDMESTPGIIKVP